MPLREVLRAVKVVVAAMARTLAAARHSMTIALRPQAFSARL